MSEIIAVTGATGTVGSCVLQLLVKEGKRVRALSRNVEKVTEKMVDTIPFDYQKKESYAAALKDVDKLLLIATQADGNLEAFLRSASHVAHVVIVSGISANSRKDSRLAEIEACVYRARLPYTTLRCNWFMQNFITFWKSDIRERGAIELPFEEAKTSLIDVRDIASVVSIVFSDEKHLNKVYNLTGGEALSYAEIAKIISDACHKPIRYESRPAREKFDEEVELLFSEVRAGKTAHISPCVEMITGQKPLTFQQFAEDHRDLW